MNEKQKQRAARGLKKAIAACAGSAGERGAQAELARRLGCARMAITQWKRRGVPIERCADIEAATGVSRVELRPDVFE